MNTNAAITNATTPLRALIVEDSTDDTALLVRELRKCGYEPASERVETADAMRAALKDKAWDIIFSDYMIPGFGAMEALQIAKQSGLDTSFVVISGKVGEEALVEIMKAGAADFLVKGRLDRLGSVVKRELADNAARRSMRQAQLEWRVAFDSVQDAMFIHDTNFRVVRANLAYAALGGLPITQVIGKPYWEIFPKAGGPMTGCVNEHETGRSTTEEIKSPSGEVYRSRSHPIADATGSYLYSLHVLEDITERNRIKDAIESSERRFRALIENSTDAFLVIDPSGKLIYRSNSGLTLTGYETNEVLGRQILDFVIAEDIPTARSALGKSLSKPGEVSRAELRARRKDGSVIDIEVVARNCVDVPEVCGVVVTARDITARKRAEQSLARVNRALKTLSDCNGALVHATNERELLHQMCRIIVESGGYRLAWVGFAEHDVRSTVRPVAYYGRGNNYLERAEISWADGDLGRGPAGVAIRTGTPHIVQDARIDPAYAPWRENAVRLGYASVLGLPLISADAPFGALCIYSAEANAFDPEEIKLLTELADDLAFGVTMLRSRIAHEQSVERLSRSMEGTIQAMAATIEMRDAYTAGHQRRVAEIAVAIAREMKLPEDEIHALNLAGVVHDLGKIQIPAEILNRPTRLTPIEFELIKMHPEAGYNILRDVDFPWPIAEIVYQHHERLDGSGYPRGLQGGEILLGARILAIADTVEAMASHRPYRPGYGIDAALDEIAKNSGKLYDAAAVDACVTLFREKHYSLPRS